MNTWYVLSAVLVLIGVAGTILPALPGIPLVFAGLLLAAWAGGFQQVSGWTVGFLGVLMVLAMLVDLAASAFGVKIAGASKWAFFGAALGAFLGLFFGLPGLLLGPFVGAISAELLVTQNIENSAKAGVGAALGILFGAVLKIALCFTMLGVFVLAWWW
jgi:uncharacterized protein